MCVCLVISKNYWNNTTFCKAYPPEYVFLEGEEAGAAPLTQWGHSGPWLTDHLQYMASKTVLEFIFTSVNDKGKQRLEENILEAYVIHFNHW